MLKSSEKFKEYFQALEKGNKISLCFCFGVKLTFLKSEEVYNEIVSYLNEEGYTFLEMHPGFIARIEEIDYLIGSVYKVCT